MTTSTTTALRSHRVELPSDRAPGRPAARYPETRRPAWDNAPAARPIRALDRHRAGAGYHRMAGAHRRRRASRTRTARETGGDPDASSGPAPGGRATCRLPAQRATAPDAVLDRHVRIAPGDRPDESAGRRRQDGARRLGQPPGNDHRQAGCPNRGPARRLLGWPQSGTAVDHPHQLDLGERRLASRHLCEPEHRPRHGLLRRARAGHVKHSPTKPRRCPAARTRARRSSGSPMGNTTSSIASMPKRRPRSEPPSPTPPTST